MSNLMHDKLIPEPSPEDNTAVNLLTRNDLRKVVVKITFAPKKPKLPNIRPRRMEFPTTVAAAEFISKICPPLNQQLGSPKILRARIAHLLRLTDPTIVSNYEIQTECEVGHQVAAGESSGVVEAEDTFKEVKDADETSNILDSIDEDFLP